MSDEEKANNLLMEARNKIESSKGFMSRMFGYGLLFILYFLYFLLYSWCNDSVILCIKTVNVMKWDLQ